MSRLSASRRTVITLHIVICQDPGCGRAVALCTLCNVARARYCDAACARRGRRVRQRWSGQRYQRSPRGRRAHAQRRVPSSWIVEALDVVTRGALDVAHVVPVRLELELEGEGREEALGDRVVPAIPLATHARPDAVAREQRSVVRHEILQHERPRMPVARGKQRLHVQDPGQIGSLLDEERRIDQQLRDNRRSHPANAGCGSSIPHISPNGKRRRSSTICSSTPSSPTPNPDTPLRAAESARRSRPAPLWCRAAGGDDPRARVE